jgi:hypothetical protein
LSKIDGFVHGFIANTTIISRWACLYEYSNAISVFLSTNSTDEQLLGQFLVADSSESAVAARCRTFNMNYLYSINVHLFQAKEGRKLIYIYGRSPLDDSLTMTKNSGTFIIPTTWNIVFRKKKLIYFYRNLSDIFKWNVKKYFWMGFNLIHIRKTDIILNHNGILHREKYDSCFRK